MLDRLIKISTLAGAFLIFCGVLKLTLFYRAFHITIIDYLTFSEIITSFLDDINILLILVAFMILQSLTVIGVIHWKTKIGVESLFEQILKVFYTHRKKYAMFFSFVVVIISGLLMFGIIGYNYLVIYILLVFIFQFFTAAFINKNDETDDVDVPNQLALLSALITIIIGIFLLAQHDIEYSNKHIERVSLKTHEGVINCNLNSKIIFLGKTDGYIFLHNAASQSSTILPVSSVESIELN